MGSVYNCMLVILNEGDKKNRWLSDFVFDEILVLLYMFKDGILDMY